MVLTPDVNCTYKSYMISVQPRHFRAKRKRPEGLGKSILKEILFFFYRICLKDMDPFEDDESNEAPGAAGNGKEGNIEKSSF